MKTSTRPCTPKSLILEEAVRILAERLPPSFAERPREAATYLVAAGLEGLLSGDLAGTVAGAVGDAARSGLPLLTDDVTRRREAHLAADLAPLIQGCLAGATWAAADGELLGSLFEGSLAADHRKSLGQYYTPEEIVDFLLERALEPFDPLGGAPFRVVDPACGGGHFLAACARRLLAAYRLERSQLARLRPGERWNDAALIDRVFRDHLAGLDIDPWAVRVSRIRLRLLAVALGATAAPEPRVGHGDALRRGTDAHAILRERYAAVVGNPPYGADLSAAEKAYVAARYHLGKGRYDTTALFVERGLELLEAGGRLAFVVPHGITRTGAYAPCRDMLLRESRLVALLDAGQAFPGVNLETVGFVTCKLGPDAAESGTRRGGSEAGSPREAAQVELATLRDGRLERLGHQAAAFYRGRPTLPIYVPGEAGTLIARLERLGQPLAGLARIRRGSPVSARLVSPPGEPGVPVIRGRDISRYAALEPAALPTLHRETPLFGVHAPAVLPAARVGFQNIASGIVATLLPAGTLPLDTVNVLEVRTGADPLALLGYLDSRLAEFYFRLAISNMANLTVHLDSPTLGSLPVIALGEDATALVAELLALRAQAAPAARLERAAAEIDAAVFAAAGLGAAERATVLRHTRPARFGRPRVSPQPSLPGSLP